MTCMKARPWITSLCQNTQPPLSYFTYISTLKIHPDGHVMALGAADGTIKIWNLTDDSLLENLKAHKVCNNTLSNNNLLK